MGAFGEKLRNQREQRGLSLDAISNTTKIGVRMLRALEDEHFDQLPGGVFNKGFVRAYARQVGLDEEETLSDYLAALRESQIQAEKILPDFRSRAVKFGLDVAERRKQNRRNSDRRNWDRRNPDSREEDLRQPDSRIKDASENHRLDEHTLDDPRRPEDRDESENRTGLFSPPDSTSRLVAEALPPPRSKPFPRTPPKLGAVALLLAVALAVWTFHSRSRPAASSQSAITSNQSAPSVSASAKPSLSPASQTFGEVSSAATSQPVPTPPATAPTLAGETTQLRPSKPPPTFTVLIRAEETTWVSILADGKPVANETLIAPAHTSVRASREVVVKTGNAAGVSFLLNGKPIRPEGNEGEVRTYVFNATGLSAGPQAQLPTPNP